MEYKVLPDGKLLVTVKRQMSYLNLTRDDLELGVRGRFMRFLEQHRLMRRPDKADVAPSVWAARLREAGVDDDDDDDAAAPTGEEKADGADASGAKPSKPKKKKYVPWEGLTTRDAYHAKLFFGVARKILVAHKCGDRDDDTFFGGGYREKTLWPTDEQFDAGFEKMFQKIKKGEIEGFTTREDEDFFSWLEKATAGSDYTEIQMSGKSNESSAHFCESSGRASVASCTDFTVFAGAGATRNADGLVEAAAFKAAAARLKGPGTIAVLNIGFESRRRRRASRSPVGAIDTTSPSNIGSVHTGGLLDRCTNQRHLVHAVFDKWAGELDYDIVTNELKRWKDKNRYDVAGFGQLDVLYSFHQLNAFYKGEMLAAPSALFDVKSIGDVFAGLGVTDNAELAGLVVQELGRVLHVCSVDVAAMSDITAIALKAIYNAHRGL